MGMIAEALECIKSKILSVWERHSYLKKEERDFIIPLQKIR